MYEDELDQEIGRLGETLQSSFDQILIKVWL